VSDDPGERVHVGIEAGVADVRLNRPDKLNGLDAAMFRGLLAAGESLAAVPGLRAVVLSGEGRAFCAGLDFASFGAGDAGVVDLFERKRESPANLAQAVAWVWRELPVPVIAAVHGVAYGGGLQIALGADLRLVAPDARLSVREIVWGLVPDMSATQTLRHLVGLDVAKELTWTGRVVSGEEAVALGLATRVSKSPREDAFALAREIAARSPDAVRAAKRLFDAGFDLGAEEGLRLEEEVQRGILGKANQVEAVRAQLERREPRFGDPD
jgi:enoyl-CoA hydratase/carnithine racemase